MEGLLFGTLGSVGSLKPKKKKNKKKSKNTIKYHSDIENQIKNATKKQARKVRDSGFGDQFGELMMDNVEGPVAINESQKTVNGFDLGLQRDLDFQNDYSEFRNTEMHYGVKPKEELFTSNMQPFTSRREFDNGGDHSYKLGVFTGQDDLYLNKADITPYNIIEPMKNLTYVNGMPVFTDFLETRYVPSYKNNNGDLPFKNNMKVRPGINGINQQGIDPVYRILPKDIDELRSKSNPKISYKGDNTGAVKKGERRAKQGKITKVKKPDFVIKSDKDRFATRADQTKQKLRYCHYQKPNDKRSQHISYSGAVHQPEKSIKKYGKVQESKRENYMSDSGSRHISNVTNKPVASNKKSFRNNETERASTSHNIVGQAVDTSKSSWVKNDKDIPLTTLRQMMIHGDTNIGITEGENKGYVFSKDFVIPQTHRSTTSHKTHVGNVAPEQSGNRVYHQDPAKQTIKQTTSHKTHTGNVAPEQSGNRVYHQDPAKQTIKQTTSNKTHVGNVAPEQSGNRIYHQDPAKQTIKQTTSNKTHVGNVAPEQYSNRVYQQDPAKQTIKQTTGYKTHVGNVAPEQYSNRVYQQDPAKQTIKQTTQHKTHVGMIQPKNNKYRIYQLDKPNQTIKQTTLHNQRGNVDNREKLGWIKNKDDKAKPTIKQTTLFQPKTNVNLSKNGTGWIRDENDKPKQTIKQTTLHNQRGHVEGKEKIGWVRDEDDKPNQTIKQSTLHSQRGHVEGKEKSGWVRDDDDRPNQTIKQTTLHSQRGHVEGKEKSGWVRDEDDKPNKTIKQTTLHSQRGNVENKEKSGWVRDKDDKPNVTIKQTTILHNYNGGAKYEHEKQTNRYDAKNMNVDDRREILTYNRPANPGKDVIGPIINSSQVKLKNENHIPYMSAPHKERNSDKMGQVFTRNKTKTKMTGNYWINNNFINQLDNNYLVNDIRHQNNKDFEFDYLN